MALTYPRDIPRRCGRVTGKTSLAYQQSRAIAGGTFPIVVDFGTAAWKSSYAFELRGRAQISTWSAWGRSMRGGLRTFKMIPARTGKLYRWPLLRPTGFTGLAIGVTPWAGLGNLSAIGAGRDTITINQLPNGLVLSAGDFLSFVVGTKQHLHQVVEGGTVAGNQVVLTVEPTIRPNASTGVSVLFEYPWCDAVVMSEIDEPNDYAVHQIYSFDAMQVWV